MNLQNYNNTWIVTPKPNPLAKLKLFCLPFAGGGSVSFRSWADGVPDTVEVSAVEIPGRGRRLSEPLLKNMPALVEAAAKGIYQHIDRPFALFGHSMGALLGFELAHFLKENYDLTPAHLFVSGRAAPYIKSREKPIHKLSEPEFIYEIKNFNGTPKEVLEHEELMELMIPILRADFEICETYTCNTKPELECPLTVFGGLQDNGATRDELEAWGKLTQGSFNLRMFPGDHFYLLNTQSTLLQTIARDINNHFDIGGL